VPPRSVAIWLAKDSVIWLAKDTVRSRASPATDAKIFEPNRHDTGELITFGQIPWSRGQAQPAKVEVVGSNPIAHSIAHNIIRTLPADGAVDPAVHLSWGSFGEAVRWFWPGIGRARGVRVPTS
jgi:hypothetical protein